MYYYYIGYKNLNTLYGYFTFWNDKIQHMRNYTNCFEKYY